MKKETVILLGFIISKFILQYILISPEYDLQRDEYLHLDQANHLAWGYLSVPPVTSWISIVINLLGNSVFWIRFFPALFGALTILVVWKAIKELNGNLFALILGSTCILFSVLLRLNILYQPNSLDVLCWTLFYFIVIKYINTENKHWLFIGAIVFAIGFLNKYNIVFLLLGLLPAILVTEHRKIIVLRSFYLSLLAGFILILPNLLWQYKNNFPVIHHLQELSETQLVNVNRWNFLKSQLLFFSGSLLVIVSGLYAILFYKPFKKHMFFAWSFVLTLIVFIIFKAKDYYAIGLYPIYIAFGSVFLSDRLKRGWKRYLQPVVTMIPVLVFIPMYHIAFPNKSPDYILANQKKYKDLGMLRWEDGKNHSLPQDYADMLGWRELAQKVDKVYSDVPDKKKTLVLCDNYGQAGAINYYTKKGIKAVSFNADYVDWFDLSFQYVHLIRVINHSEKAKEFPETKQLFNSSIVADSITNHLAREYGTTIYLFMNAKTDINKIIQSEIEKVKSFDTD